MNHKPGIVLLLSCQAAFIIAGLVGGLATIKRSILLFYIPAFIYLGTLSTLIILGIVTLRESNKDLSHEILKSLENDANSSGFQWISEVQWEVNFANEKS